MTSPDVDDQLPDTRLFWTWVGRALRPYAGWICAGIGFIVIILGWFGVSGQALVAKQLPYLISGGIGGIAIVGVGAAYVAVDQIRRDSGRLDRLERMVDELHRVLLTRPDAPPAWQPPAGEQEMSRNGSDRIVALPVGQTFHRSGCSMVLGKEHVEPVTPADVAERGLRPCRICEPELVSK